MVAATSSDLELSVIQLRPSSHGRLSLNLCQMQTDGACETTAELWGRLGGAFSLLQSPDAAWARSFLLDTNPTTTLSVLAHADAVSRSIEVTCVDACAEAPVKCGAGHFDMSVTFQGLFIPARSADGLSVGVIVNRLAPVSGVRDVDTYATMAEEEYWLKTPHSFAVGRYVRNDETKEMLIVKRTARVPGYGLKGTGVSDVATVQIMHKRLLGRGYRERTMFICEEARWPRSSGGENIHLEEIYCAIMLFMSYAEGKFCESCCRLMGTVWCSCRPVAPPQGPRFDVAGSFESPATLNGEFRGTAQAVTCFRDGTNSVCSEEGPAVAWYSVSGTDVSELADSGGVIATRENAEETSFLSSFPNGPVRYKKSARMESRMRAFGCSPGGDRAGPLTAPAGLLRQFAVQFSLYEQGSTLSSMPTTRPLAVGRFGPAVDGLIEPPAAAFYDTEWPSTSARQGPVPRSNGLGSSLFRQKTLLDDGPSENFPPAHCLDAATRSIESDAVHSLNHTYEYAGFLRYLAVGETVTPIRKNEGPVITETVNDLELNRAAVALLDGIEAKRLAQAKERKRKNRLAATRANARRKAYREGLIAGIANLRVRIAELRLREIELFESNMKLRYQLQSHGVRFPVH
jgi:hypothetical protein